MRPLLMLSFIVLFLSACTSLNLPPIYAPDAAGNATNPPCRVNSVKLKAAKDSKVITPRPENCKTERLEDDYHELCNTLVTKLDKRCQNSCDNYRKRSNSAPTDPNITGRVCDAFPTVPTIEEYDPSTHCEDKNNKITISCSVTASCTCDP